MIKSEKVAALYDAEQIKEICRHCRSNYWGRCSHCAIAERIAAEDLEVKAWKESAGQKNRTSG